MDTFRLARLCNSALPATTDVEHAIQFLRIALLVFRLHLEQQMAMEIALVILDTTKQVMGYAHYVIHHVRLVLQVQPAPDVSLPPSGP
jgi:hypothetical protein